MDLARGVVLKLVSDSCDLDLGAAVSAPDLESLHVPVHHPLSSPPRRWVEQFELDGIAERSHGGSECPAA